MNRLWKLALPIAAMAIAAIGCGDGGDGGDTPTLSSQPTASVLGASAPPDEEGDVAGDETCTPQTYEVQSGDTLSQIATQFDVSAEAIAGASGVSDPNFLTIGQELTIPCPGQLPSTPQPEEETAQSPTPDS